MTKEIDERIVSMKFDNKQFESNIQTSSKSLSDFNKKLQFNGATKGLTNVDSAIKKINFSPLGDAVEKVGMKFSSLEVMAVTTLANITNSAVNAGKRMISALTIDPITTGFQEYETQINAVQTILANTESKGTTLQDVNKALDELNTYADKTIYNFTEMTKNIGTFTAAGVDLDTSVNAIKGIANLAAVSGSTSMQASTAMYQLSQALASGSVKLMDWNSVVNAGMGGQVFQDALKNTARVHGIAIDDMIEKEGSFRETLSNGWLSSDILTETLSHFTMAAEQGTEQWETYKKSLIDQGYTKDQAEEILRLSNTATDAATKVKTFTQLWDTLKESAQSGWTQTWEIMIGDFGEAKEFLTNISEAIGGMLGASADARNAVLSGGLSSGWKQLLNAGIADEEGYKDSLKSIAKEHEISIDDMIKAEKKLDASLDDNKAFDKVLKKGLKDGTISSDMLSESVYNLSDKMSKMSAEERKAAGYTQEHVQQINELASGLRNGSVSMDDFVDKIIRSSGRENIIEALWNAFDGLMSVVKPIKEAFDEIFRPLTSDQVYSFTESLKALTEKLTISGETADKLKRIFKGVFATFDIAIQLISAIVRGLGILLKAISPVGTSISNVVADLGDFLVGLNDSIKSTNAFNKAIATVEKVLQPIIKVIKIGITYVKQFAKAIGETFSEQLNKFDTKNLEKTTENVKNKIRSLTQMSETNKMIFTALGKVMAGVVRIFATLGDKLANIFGGMTEGISDFISNISFEDIVDVINTGLIATIGVGVKNLVDSLNGLLNSGLVVAVGLALKKFADSFSSVSNNINSILSGVHDTLKTYQQDLKANVLLKIAGAIGILALSLVIIASIDPEKLGTALMGITALFGELMLTLKLFDKNFIGKKQTGLITLTTSLIGMAIAISILSLALVMIASLDADQLLKGLIGVGALIGGLTLAAKALSKSESKLIKGAFGLIIFATAIVILTKAVENLAGLNTKALMRGLVGVAVLVAELALFLHLADNANMGIGKGVGFILLAAAINILATAVSKFGAMSTADMISGLIAMGVALGQLTVFMKIVGNPTKVISTAISMAVLGGALKIIASVLKDMGSLSFSQLGKGLLGVAGALTMITIAMRLLPKNILAQTIALIGVATAFVIISKAFKVMGTMSWGEIGKGLVALAASLGILAVALNVIKGSITGAASLLVMGVALSILTPQLQALGSMNWKDLVVGLLALAGTFAVIGVAALLLTKVSAVILQFAGAMAVVGISVALLGFGVAALATGLTTISISLSALVTAIVSIVMGLISLIPAVFKELGKGIIALCDVLIDGMPAIGEAIMVTILTVLDVLRVCVPDIVSTLFMLIFEILGALCKNIGPLIDGIIDFLVTVVNGVAKNLPRVIEAVVNVLMSLLQGVIDVLNNIDPKILVNGIVSLGFILALLSTLTLCARMVPTALVGAIGIALVISELGLIFAAFGVISERFDGLVDIIDEGSELLGSIGAAIGNFIGNFIGSTMSGITNNLPNIGTDLSDFMSNLKPFIEGAKNIDTNTMNGVKALVDTIILFTAANVIEGFASFLPGADSLTEFGKDIANLGPYLAEYANSVKGIDSSTVVASATAAKALAEMAHVVPNEGGVVAWFTGENSISKFGDDLLDLGEGLLLYSNSIKGFDSEAVLASVEGGKAIASLASEVPNEGGVAAWFAGDNSISKFGDDLVDLGTGLASYSNKVTDFDSDAVIASAEAAAAIVEMAGNIPNEEGLVAWFTGDNSISKFGDDLVDLGEGMAEYSELIKDFDSDAVIASAEAATAIVEMADKIPNEGGVAAWFTGDNSISKFGDDLIDLGEGMAGYSDAVKDFNTDAVTASIDAATAIVKMTDKIPNEGGVVAWFTGDNSISKFGDDLVDLGEGLASYSDSIKYFDAEAVTASAKAAAAIVELADEVPNEGGVVAWFTGDNSIAKFGDDLVDLGEGLASYSDSIKNSEFDNVEESVDAAIAIAELTKYLPNEGGIKQWFTGTASISSFAGDLEDLGTGLCNFATSIKGMTDADCGRIKKTVESALPLVEMSNNVPNEGGIKQWFTGTASVSSFAGDLEDLGTGLYNFATSIKDMTDEDCSRIGTAATAAKNLATMTDTVPKEGGFKAWINGSADIEGFADGLETLGAGLVNFSDSTKGIDASRVEAGANAAKKLAEIANSDLNMSDLTSFITGETDMSKFADGLYDLGKGLYNFGYWFSGDDIDIDKTNAAANVAKALGDMVKNLPDKNIIESLFTGDSALINFSGELDDLGRALYNFAFWVSSDDIDIGKTSDAADIIKGIADMYQYLPDVDGFLQFFTGEKKMGTFIDAISDLGNVFSSFYDEIENVKINHLYASVSNLKTLVTLLKNDESDLENITETIDVLDNLSNVGTSVSDFYDNISDISTDTISVAKQVFSNIKDLFDIDSKGGFDEDALMTAASCIENIAYSLQDMADFSIEQSTEAFVEMVENLESVGSGLVEFSKSVEGLDASGTSNAATAASNISSILTILTPYNTTYVDSYADNFDTLGESIKDFGNNLAGIEVAKVASAASSLKTLMTIVTSNKEVNEGLVDVYDILPDIGANLNEFNNLAKSISVDTMGKIKTALLTINEVATAIDSDKMWKVASGVTQIKDVISGISAMNKISISGFIASFKRLAELNIDSFVNALDVAVKSIEDVGSLSIDAFVSGAITQIANVSLKVKSIGSALANDLGEGVKDSMIEIVNDCISVIKAKRTDFQTCGKNLVKGLCDGITDTAFYAKVCARALANTAIEAAKDELGIESPSKVFYSIGANTGIGYINALHDYENKVGNAGSNLGKASIRGINNAVSYISDIINDDLDTQPAIRPVMDLSDVETGANSINSMFSQRRTLSLRIGSLDAISASMSNRQNRSETHEMISALNGLRKDVANMPRNSYSIGNVSYEEGSDVAEALQTIIRATRIEGRV